MSASRASAIRRSSTRYPSAPKRSKNETWGLMAAAVSMTASRTASEQNSSPSTESGRSQASSNWRLGSMPTHSGPSARMRDCKRVPNESAMGGPHYLVDVVDVVTSHPLLHFLLNDPGRTGIGEVRRADLNGVGPGHQHGDRVLTGADSTYADNGRCGKGVATFVHRAQRHRQDSRPAEPAHPVTQRGAALLDVNRHAEHGVDEHQGRRPRLERRRGDGH